MNDGRYLNIAIHFYEGRFYAEIDIMRDGNAMDGTRQTPSGTFEGVLLTAISLVKDYETVITREGE